MHPRRKWTGLPSWINLFMENKIKTKQPFTRSRLVSRLLACGELANRSSEQAIMFPQSLSFKLLVRFIGINSGLSCFSERGTGFVWTKRGFSRRIPGTRALPLGVGRRGRHQAAGGLQSRHHDCWATEYTVGTSCGLPKLEHTVLHAEAAAHFRIPPPPAPLTLRSFLSVLRQRLHRGDK